MPSARLPCRVALSLAAALMIAAALPPAAALIKQTQLGEVDWLLQHVGEVQHAQFAPRGPKVFVGTAASVVACLHLRDGEILWRQVHTRLPVIFHGAEAESTRDPMHGTQISGLRFTTGRAPASGV